MNRLSPKLVNELTQKLRLSGQLKIIDRIEPTNRASVNFYGYKTIKQYFLTKNNFVVELKRH